MAPTRTTTRPPVLFLAAVVLVAEAVVAIAFGAFEIPRIHMSRFVVGAGVSLLTLGYGACLLILARAVGRGLRWSRGPAVATQLLQGLLGISFGTGATLWVGLLLGIAALVVLVCLLAPAATAVFAPPDIEE